MGMPVRAMEVGVRRAGKAQTIPAGRAGDAAGLPDPRSRASGGRGDFAAKTLAGIAEALERAIFSDDSARLPGLLQGIDPRSKVLGAALLLAVGGIARHVEVLVALHAATLLLAALSLLPLGSFVRRVWAGIPLFAAMVALPSLVMLPGTPLLSLPLGLRVSDNGVASFSLLVVRVATSVALVLLLVSTTRWSDLLAALRTLGVPESFVVVLGMTYRYLFLLLRAADSLFLSRASRTVGHTSGREQRRWAAAVAGVLMSRSVKMGGDVLLAMRARGFAGEIRTRGFRRMSDGDWLVLVLGVVMSAGLLLLDQRPGWL